LNGGEGAAVGVLEPTPETGSWTVEALTNRVRLRRSAPAECGVVAAPARSVHADVVLPEPGSSARRLGFVAADLGPVIAALDVVVADDLYFDYINDVDVDLGRWGKVRVDENWVTVDGPVLAAVTKIHGSSVEVSYAHVAELRLVLADFANARAAGGFT
jgi:hypothetical protein